MSLILILKFTSLVLPWEVAATTDNLYFSLCAPPLTHNFGMAVAASVNPTVKPVAGSSVKVQPVMLSPNGSHKVKSTS